MAVPQEGGSTAPISPAGPGRPIRTLLALGGLQILSHHAAAEVTSVSGSGFEVRERVHVAAPAASLYAALIAPNRWWDPKHTFSGDAARLSLDARAGGCWCESLPDGGSAEHMTVVYVSPGKALRLSGALGPLQAMGAAGSMTFSIVPAGPGADLTVSYAVGGYSKDGFDALAKAVDSVLAGQVARLQRLAETGSADARAL